MAVWQVASGAGGRDYSGLCIEHDVMLLGPGSPGDIQQCIEDYDPLIESGRVSKSKVNSIRKFADQVRPGDQVLLRNGHRVVALGVVDESGYLHDERFDDIFGWDLQHCHRVRWNRAIDKELAELQAKQPLFGTRKQIPMFTRVKHDSVLAPIRHLLSMQADRDLADLPSPPSDVMSQDEIGESLFSRGLSLASIDDLLATFERQRRMLRWYQEHGRESGRPTEHEVVAYMILPILLALGWSEQLLAVEWNKVDLAAFSDTPTINRNCVLVCEAKRMGSGLQGNAYGQAVGYIGKHGFDRCKHVLLTQGQRFYLYRMEASGEWPKEPTGYLNLAKIRERYMMPAGVSAIDTLTRLTPTSLLHG